MMAPPLAEESFTVGWICALPTEMAAATAMLDEEYERPKTQPSHDQNNYCLGRMGTHNVVIACLPAGVYGTNSAAAVGVRMLSSFSYIRFGLMVGIGGGVPSAKNDIRLGDVVVSRPQGRFGGVVQYDLGKVGEDGELIGTGSLNKPPTVLLTAIAGLEAAQMKDERNGLSRFLKNMFTRYPKMEREFGDPGAENDCLYEAGYPHQEGDTCVRCNSDRVIRRSIRQDRKPHVFYGTIASGNQVIKDSVTRDHLASQYNAICIEMEAAGLMDNFPCLVIRGICDYADSHKNKDWQGYAAATASAYAKELLYSVPSSEAGISRSAAQTVKQMAPISTPSLTFIATNNLHAREDVPLASMVPDRRCPNQDALVPIIVNGEDFSLSVDSQFSQALSIQTATQSLVKRQLARLFSKSNDKDIENYQVSANESRLYLLRQPNGIFRRICGLDHAKEWLQECYEYGQDVYFVVGYRTLLNACLIPQRLNVNTEKNHYQMLGERIYAICYRKITVKRLKGKISPNLDSGNCWRLFLENNRGSGKETVMEALLESEGISVDDGGEYSLVELEEDEV
ncbi:hypothetical protein IFM61392_09452 [Aspergillus lentulus]|uniref:Nucleoside phosphorylase domain-containing protein n=1 Tax=Aspergillus lentulus TaxID=293939 RepID=A0AAN6BS45_ASPLE|nr:hypothetical protein CNMCM6069_000507 [Aspergillus lentulus]KAF4172968.1 hypothetical protein CNMCM8060_000709 [Aspergillus lentulus]KAF4185646.1 hypothetical protein CNMCM7927_006464 [Aspergillus lentulus]KAF4190873.1 hypothetical protein CNMCM8694_002827 [Aspergillus lentulus]KAF4206921.1 hypothetical protein CNMCM8927_004256 [Aspergillus lentulus]